MLCYATFRPAESRRLRWPHDTVSYRLTAIVQFCFQMAQVSSKPHTPGKLRFDDHSGRHVKATLMQGTKLLYVLCQAQPILLLSAGQDMRSSTW